MSTSLDAPVLCVPEEDFICRDIRFLFNRLNIPLGEQVILWEMGMKEMDCIDFKKILSVLAGNY